MVSLMEKDNFSIPMDRIMSDILLKVMLIAKEDLSVLKDGYMRANCRISKLKEKEYFIINY